MSSLYSTSSRPSTWNLLLKTTQQSVQLAKGYDIGSHSPVQDPIMVPTIAPLNVRLYRKILIVLTVQLLYQYFGILGVPSSSG